MKVIKMALKLEKIKESNVTLKMWYNWRNIERSIKLLSNKNKKRKIGIKRLKKARRNISHAKMKISKKHKWI